MNLKCLSHSAVEMRALQNQSSNEFGGDSNGLRRGSVLTSSTSTGYNNYANHQRSRSFDATVGKKSPGVKSNLLSGLLNRFKGGSSPGNEAGEEDSQTSTFAPPTTPVSTVLVVDPSGCGPAITTISPTPVGSPASHSQARSPVSGSEVEPKEGIPWDNNTGYFLDASVLGLAIENHLKKGDKGQKRRATFCTVSETSSQLLGHFGNAGASYSNRPRSASAYSVLPFYHASGPVDPETISKRRESIASVFPSIKGSTGFLIQQPRRNSSFNSEPLDFNSPQQEVIVGSFIKTSMTSELYSEGEVIQEEEPNDIESYDDNNKQSTFGSGKGDSKLLSGIDFLTRKPAETIINLFSSTPSDNNNAPRRFSLFSNFRGRGSVTTINEEAEEEAPLGTSAGSQRREAPQHRTFCVFFRNIIMQIYNSFFRS